MVAGAWIALGLACLAKGSACIALSAEPHLHCWPFFTGSTNPISFAFVWPYLLLFAAMVAPWYIWVETHFKRAFHSLVER